MTAMEVDGPPLLAARDIEKSFSVKGRSGRRRKERVQAVRGVSFELRAGETLALVGESGCGKSTIARLVVSLLRPDRGEILVNGHNVLESTGADLRRLRQRVQIIFQDPHAALNPRMTVRQLLSEAWTIHPHLRPAPADREDELALLIERVGLHPDHLARYPHEFSGGQRQRIGIARALSARPEAIVCDEPLSALDVSIQAQIIELMRELQRDLGLSYLFISHDLGVVRQIADRVAVMYLGRMVETGESETIFRSAAHPYTRGLIAAVPSIHSKGSARVRMGSELPDPAHPPSGCGFRTRCDRAESRCAEEVPELELLAAGQRCACFVAREDDRHRISPAVPATVCGDDLS
ncbi:ABC transporter ATP-binding protein [Pseudonocardia sp.]|jgi:oligopeptide/dipeptide ABC transporter ATP-binding protein|uniref:ABC transporter ATP-binding protein n=1 Tax=Pseudonocardia sp. TaxID=60912 RepID=UPI003D0D6F77